jgi:stage V sporulation protein SpoVS
MQDGKKDEKTTSDDSLLLISGSKGSKKEDKEYAKKISGAIISCITKYDNAKLRCVGAASLNNAIKGIIIAKNDILKRGEYLLVNPSFTMVRFGDEEKTGLILEAISIKTFEKDGNLNRDEALLKVRGNRGSREENKEYVKKLSNAVLSCFSKQGIALLRFVGVSSGNNALKAATIAVGNALLEGKTLMIDPSFTTVKFGEEEKTGMILEIISV